MRPGNLGRHQVGRVHCRPDVAGGICLGILQCVLQQLAQLDHRLVVLPEAAEVHRHLAPDTEAGLEIVDRLGLDPDRLSVVVFGDRVVERRP